MTFLNQKETNLLPAFIVGSVCVQIISFLILTITFGKVAQIAGAKTPVLVELADGTSARVAPQAFNERSPQAITAFTSRTMMGLLSWKALLASNPSDFDKAANKAQMQLDEGVQVGEGKVTTAAWEASF